MEETKSNWQCVAEYVRQSGSVALSKEGCKTFFSDPLRLFHRLAYYKFAAKLAGKRRSLLDLDPQEGISTYLLSQECKSASGLVSNASELSLTNRNFQAANLSFLSKEAIKSLLFDALVYFPQGKQPASLADLPLERLEEKGMLLLGAPSSDHAQGLLLQRELKSAFSFVFQFGAWGQCILPRREGMEAPYTLHVGCQKK